MERMPPELLARFIGESLDFPLDSQGLQSFQTLRAVCSRWRSISFSTRTLWSALSVNLRHPSNDAHLVKHIRRWFTRAGPTAPLRLIVEDVGLIDDPHLYEANRVALTQLVHEYHQRWNHLTIAVRTNTLEFMFPPIATPRPTDDASWSTITTLNLFQRPCPKYLPPHADLSFLSRIPNLKRLSLRLPQTPAMIPICPKVVSLEVCIPEPFELHLPTLFPALQELSVEPLLWEFPMPEGQWTFPNLKALTMETFESGVFDVMERLVCPSLQELGLRFGQRRSKERFEGSFLVKVFADFVSRSKLSDGLKALSILRSPAFPGADSAIATLLESLPTLVHVELRRWPFQGPIPHQLLPHLSSLVIRDLRPGSVHEPFWEGSELSLFGFVEARGQRNSDETSRGERVARLHEVVLYRGRGKFPLDRTKRLVDLGINVKLCPDDALACFK